MDTKFQTSFIPKKPILAEQKVVKGAGSTSIFMFIAVIIFIVSLTIAVFLVVWKSLLIKSQENYIVNLKKAEERFDTATIEKLKKVNTKIDLSKKLLKSHMAVSEIFNIISALTIEGIRFKSFNFTAPVIDGDVIKISMKGVGSSFSAIAFQSDVFGQSSKFGKNKTLKNPVMSDLVLDDLGNVNFTFTATIDSMDVSYDKKLEELFMPDNNTQN
ncbi:MAG: hypothetical protein AAB683_00260 [Patescibacteria group bacterium]